LNPRFSAHQVLDAPDFESLGKVQDVARLLNVSRSWVYAHKHELPHVRIGGLLRFDLAEVRSWSPRQRAADLTRLQTEVVHLRGEAAAESGDPREPR